MFTDNVTLGNLLTIVSFIVMGVSVIMTIKADTRLLGVRLTALEKLYDKVSEAITSVVSQEARLNGHSERIARLERKLDD